MARVSSSGSGGAGGSPQAIAVYTYNEVTNVNPGVETMVATYTVASGPTSYLQFVASSCTNVAIYRVYVNSNVIDKRYGSYTQYNVTFEYFTGNTTAPGIPLNPGDIIKVTMTQNQASTADSNAEIQVLEVES